MLCCEDEVFEQFEQVYLMVAVVKGWHHHKRQTGIFIPVNAMLKLVFYDSREDSPTYGEINQFVIGERNPMLVTIPPGGVHGFKAIGIKPAYLINVPTEPNNYQEPEEFRIPPNDPSIPYDWSLREGSLDNGKGEWRP